MGRTAANANDKVGKRHIYFQTNIGKGTDKNCREGDQDQLDVSAKKEGSRLDPRLDIVLFVLRIKKSQSIFNLGTMRRKGYLACINGIVENSPAANV